MRGRPTESAAPFPTSMPSMSCLSVCVTMCHEDGLRQHYRGGAEDQLQVEISLISLLFFPQQMVTYYTLEKNNNTNVN